MSDWMHRSARRTLYESRRALLAETPSGHLSDLRPRIGEGDLPDRVELVWHGVNDRANLRHFLASPVRWGECDVRRDGRGRLVLRHDAFEEAAPPAQGDGPARALMADEFLWTAVAEGKGVKLDVKQRDILDELLALVDRTGIHGRFSLAWGTTHMAMLLAHLDQWGHDVNLYAVENLDDFLRAVLLLPRSVTADFNFPEWHYFGRGAGRGGRYHRYHLDPAPASADVA